LDESQCVAEVLVGSEESGMKENAIGLQGVGLMKKNAIGLQGVGLMKENASGLQGVGPWSFRCSQPVQS